MRAWLTLFLSLITFAASAQPYPSGTGAIGTTADTMCTSPASICTLVAIGKAILNAIQNPPALGISGGWSPSGKTAIGSTPVTVKASPGQLGFALCDNNNNAWTYLQLMDAASPAIGTNVGFLSLPPNLSGGYTLSLVGLQFQNSISVGATTAPGGSSAPSTTINCMFGFN